MLLKLTFYEETLMEKDGKTRLYYHHDQPPKVKEAWPQHAGWGEGAWALGEVAEETFANADFFCVSCLVRNGTDHWIVRPANEENAPFNVNYLHDSNANYAHLAQRLEDHSHKKGLTVIIY